MEYFEPGKVYRFNVVKSMKHFKGKYSADEILKYPMKDRIIGASKNKFVVRDKSYFVKIADSTGFEWSIFPNECDIC